MFIDNGSPNAVIASSNETPCFLRFDSAFRGSHSKLYSTCAFYRSVRQVFIGITLRVTRGRRARTSTVRRELTACRRVHALDTDSALPLLRTRKPLTVIRRRPKSTLEAMRDASMIGTL